MQRIAHTLRMRSSRLGAAAAISGMLCVVTIIFAVRSAWVFNQLEGDGPSRAYRGCDSRLVIQSSVGRFWILLVDPIGEHDDSEPKQWQWTWGSWPASEDQSSHKWSWGDLWFHVWNTRNTDVLRVGSATAAAPQGGSFSAIIPYWSLAVLCAVLPALWALKRRRRRARQKRLLERECCRNCGYDLRGTPARCPECGAPVGDRESGETSARGAQSSSIHESSSIRRS